ncbi:MAG: uracil-DNA glycosylase family protein [Anaerolineales bacterium]|nr:uracil-DNA glycosylase family protein [Anaerolineales bacterium]
MKQLRYEMKSCTLCIDQGFDIIPRAIFSGTENARIMVIGQAPGVTEVEAGRPFNAGSGSRLFQWLAEVGINEEQFRTEQYMTSVTKCFPGKAPSGAGDRVPSKTEQMLCRPFLEREITLVDPMLILPVGRLAINLFFAAKEPLSSLIGQKVYKDNRWIVPLPHPSGASRWHQSEENRERIRQAIQQIVGILEYAMPEEDRK